MNNSVNEVKALLTRIQRHNEAYRAGHPEVSDSEYDAEVELLRKLDPDNDWFKHIEPAPVGNGRKVKLPIPMKSLNKVKNIAELNNWIKSLGLNSEQMLAITPKFDGLSLLHDEFTDKAYSRGGADNEGQDCSAHYKAAGFYKCQNDELYFTFGELVFNRRAWELYFAGKVSPETGDKYKSPRNTAAGLLNRDKPSRGLQYISFFRYGTDDNSLTMFKQYTQLYLYLCKKYDQQKLYSVSRVKDLNEELLSSLFKEWSKYYYIDGLVIYINDLNIWKVIGRNQTSGNPLYAIAYKHPDFTDSFETYVKGVSWKANKSGALKPVVNIEAVDTGDCSMENPTGYNAKWIAEKKIAGGAKILVTRSGGVIPKILQTLYPAPIENIEALWDDLGHCPHCGAKTEWNETHVELCCTNPDCSGKRLAEIIFFFLTCGAENVGDETYTKLFNAGYDTIESILNIKRVEILNIDTLGIAIANQIIANNQKILAGVDLPTLIQASNCFVGIGKVKAKKIIENDLSSDLLEKIYNGEHYAYSWPCDNVSDTTNHFLKYLPTFTKFVRRIGVPILREQAIEQSNNKCAGFNVCFSGIRDSELERTIIQSGGKIANGVSKTTTHLIVKDIGGTSSKITKAQSLQIPILTIADFKSKFDL